MKNLFAQAYWTVKYAITGDMSPSDGDAFMSGYRAGCPCEGDVPEQDIDRQSKAYIRGYKAGRVAFNSLQQRYPHMIVNGVIRDDSDE